MININNLPIKSVYVGDKLVYNIYVKDTLVWELLSEVLSCYANGYWIDDQQWTDDTQWSDFNNI